MIKLRNLLIEGISPVLYHTTNAYRLESILSSDTFRLTAGIGTDAENATIKNPYFMSFARSMTSAYSQFREPYAPATFMKIDGRKLSSNYSGKSVDYWFTGEKRDTNYMKHNEMEDRIFSTKPEIKNATKYIDEIYIYVGEHKQTSIFDIAALMKQGKSQKEIDTIRYNTFVTANLNPKEQIILRKVLILAKKKNIPIFLFNNANDLKSGNKKNIIKTSDIDLSAKSEKYGPDWYSSLNNSGWVTLIPILYYAKSKSVLNTLVKYEKKLASDLLDSSAMDLLDTGKDNIINSIISDQVAAVKRDIHSKATSGNRFVNQIVTVLRKERTDMKGLFYIILRKWSKFYP